MLRRLVALLTAFSIVLSTAAPAFAAPSVALESLDRTVDRGTEFIRREQGEDGSWTALIKASSVRYNVYTIFLYQYLGLIDQKRDQVKGLMDWVWSQRTSTGGLPGYPGAPDDLDLSVQAYMAARMAGESEDAPRMKTLAGVINRMGGISKTGGTAKPYLWLFGLDSLGQCMPSDTSTVMMWLDSSLPWIRVMIYPIVYMIGQNKIHRLKKHNYPFALKKPVPELCMALPKPFKDREGQKQKFYDWVEKHLNDDGTMFDYSPTTVPTLMALGLSPKRYERVIARGIQAIESFQERTPEGIYQAPGEASIAESYLALQTLIDSGVPHDDPVVREGENFLLSRMQKDTGAFGFSKQNIHFPDTDDTANAITTLYDLALAHGESHPEQKFLKGLDWLIAQQNKDGGFGTWEKDRLPIIRTLVNHTGVSGFVLAESVVEHTARVALTLNRFRTIKPAYEQSYQKAINWLLSQQKPDGGYFGTWFVNRLFGTAMVAAAFGTNRASKRCDDAAKAALHFIFSYQSAEDGGFSESPRSFNENRVVPLADSSPAQTGLIVSQLLWYFQLNKTRWASYEAFPISRAVDFLTTTQGNDGRWNDGTWTGVTFPKVEYLIYPYVQDLEAIHAVARYREITR